MDSDDLIESFNHFDRDGDGRIDLAEFGELCQALGGAIDDEHKRIGFKAIDSNRNGAIDFDEFVAWWRDRL